MNTKIISAICITLAICLAIYFYAEWQKVKFDAALPPPPPVEEQAGGHWHGDEWHGDGTHPDDKLIPSVDWEQHVQLRELVKPENLDELDADDPVAKAWAKLDEIAANRFAWGGNADPRTAALIQQLTPIPAELTDHNHGDEVDDLLSALAYLRDPRSIEILVAYHCEGPGILLAAVNEALIAMGPPVIPHLIPYLDKDSVLGLFTAAHVLSRVGAQHRAELDGIVEHILLPKLERFITDESMPNFAKMDARDALAILK